MVYKHSDYNLIKTPPIDHTYQQQLLPMVNYKLKVKMDVKPDSATNNNHDNGCDEINNYSHVTARLPAIFTIPCKHIIQDEEDM